MHSRERRARAETRRTVIAAGRHRSGPRAAAGERWLYGRHAVIAALANPERRWRRLAVLAGQEAEAQQCSPPPSPSAAAATARRSTFSIATPFRRCCRRARCIKGWRSKSSRCPNPISTICCASSRPPPRRCVIVALDQVSDPQNVGAVLRSAAAFGARGGLIAAHGAPPVTGALAKAASGAVDRVPLIRAVNLARALARLKEHGFWVCGLDETADRALADIDLGARAVLVLGSEGGGMRRLVREHCDHLARLPTSPAQPTLNVSNAAAVALYELARSTAPR